MKIMNKLLYISVITFTILSGCLINSEEKLNNTTNVLDESNILNVNSDIKTTQLPMDHLDYLNCNSNYALKYCRDRYYEIDLDELPITLRYEYKIIYDADTAFKLPNINNIEIYLIGRTSTDVEEYAIITYHNTIIDELLIGRIGADGKTDLLYTIDKEYDFIKIKNNKLTKLYRINPNGEIKLFN